MTEHDNGSARNHIEGEIEKPKSLRQTAKDMGVSHTSLWRWKLMAEIPDDEFEALLSRARAEGRILTTRSIADYARRRRGDWIPADIEHCPHCGEPIRRRN